MGALCLGACWRLGRGVRLRARASRTRSTQRQRPPTGSGGVDGWYGDPVKVLAISAAKGGVGKTTSSLYFATCFAEMLGGTRDNPAVALVDRDHSRNLTRLIETDEDLLRPGVVLMPGTTLPPESAGFAFAIVGTPPGLDAINSLREMIVNPPCDDWPCCRRASWRAARRTSSASPTSRRSRGDNAPF